MRDLSYVLRSVEAGHSVRFMRDFYGRQTVEVRTAWIWRVKVQLSNAEILVVKDAIRRRRGHSSQAA